MINRWRRDEPCYAFVSIFHDFSKNRYFRYLHGMYAFGLQECAQYAEAEAHALYVSDE